MFAVWLLPAVAGADQRPAKGKLLVATELVRGDHFAETVVLLLHYDDTGAMGIVVNRPTVIETGELLADLDDIHDYSGKLFWGGPVGMNSLRVLLRTDTPPEGADAIVDSVHYVAIGDWLKDAPMDLASLRFFIGYSGWTAGQLDREMALGSWHVVPASDEHVFAEDPRILWKRLTPPREHRVSAGSQAWIRHNASRAMPPEPDSPQLPALKGSPQAGPSW
jgi:putative transcriptional regulator